MALFKALSNISHNGVLVKAGEIIEIIEDDIIASLTERQLVEPTQEGAAVAQPPLAPQQAAPVQAVAPAPVQQPVQPTADQIAHDVQDV